MSIDLFGFLGPTMLLAFAVPLLTTVLVIGVIVWAIRRSVPPTRIPRSRSSSPASLVARSIPAEYQVRMRALEEDD